MKNKIFTLKRGFLVEDSQGKISLILKKALNKKRPNNDSYKKQFN